MKWLTPLIDTHQINTTIATAPAETAVILVRCGDGWQAPLIWRAASIDAEALGDFDAEASEIGTSISGPYISPVIVLRDPTGQFHIGCDTRSHWGGDTARLDRHVDCEHNLASRLLHPGRAA